MIKIQYTPQAGPFGDMPDVQEITMTLGDNVTWDGATDEFHNFLRAAGYVIPYDFEEEREWVGITNEDYQVGWIYSDEFLEGVDWAEATLKRRNT